MCSEMKILLHLEIIAVLGNYINASKPQFSDFTDEPQCYSRFDYEYKVVQKLVALENANKGLIDSNDEMKSVIEKTNRAVDVLNKEIEELKQKSSSSRKTPYVAFSAYLDHTLTNVGQHETIIFNQVVLNEAEAYDTNSGIFTCPQDGVYLFSFFIGIRHNKQFFASLMINDERIAEAVVEGYHKTQDLQGGNLIILKLKKDDKAWIRSKESGYTLESGRDVRISTFSAVLVHPTEDTQ